MELLGHVARILVLTLSSNYAKVVLHFLSLLLWLRDSKHPLWSVFLTEASCFSEELGEISLGTLARMLVGDPMRSSIQHTRMIYLLQRQYVSVFSQVTEEADVDVQASYEFADIKSAEGKLIFSFISLYIQRNLGKKYYIYSGKYPQWKSSAACHDLHVVAPVNMLIPSSSSWAIALGFLTKFKHEITGRRWSEALLVEHRDRKVAQPDPIPEPQLEDIDEPDRNELSDSDIDDLGNCFLHVPNLLGGLPEIVHMPVPLPGMLCTHINLAEMKVPAEVIEPPTEAKSSMTIILI